MSGNGFPNKNKKSCLHDIKRPDAFRTLLALAARQTGSLINVSEWAQISNLSRDSVYAYLEILQSAHILELIRPFAGGKRAEITRSPKVYWLDTGLRNRLLGNFQPFDQRMDRGALLENWVFTEITKHLPPLAEILFWRSLGGAEVDFVIRNGDRLVALEVKSTRSPRLRIPRSSRSFIDAYRPAVFGVVQPGAQPHGPHRPKEILRLHQPLVCTLDQRNPRGGHRIKASHVRKGLNSVPFHCRPIAPFLRRSAVVGSANGWIGTTFDQKLDEIL